MIHPYTVTTTPPWLYSNAKVILSNLMTLPQKKKKKVTWKFVIQQAWLLEHIKQSTGERLKTIKEQLEQNLQDSLSLRKVKREP